MQTTTTTATSRRIRKRNIDMRIRREGRQPGGSRKSKKRVEG
jgi:hypothetical protein